MDVALGVSSQDMPHTPKKNTRYGVPCLEYVCVRNQVDHGSILNVRRLAGILPLPIFHDLALLGTACKCSHLVYVS